MNGHEIESHRAARDFLLKIQSRGWRCSLSEMQRAVQRLGDPHRKLKVIHIAGTNGKGSVAAMCSSILQSAGIKTGLFISPHLIDVRERIRLNGREIPDKVLSELVLDLARKFEHGCDSAIELTFFEFLTAVCIEYLVSEDAEVLVAETGLGGRFDATNVLQSDVAVITQIGLDHTAQLGDTIEKVAAEKAGIIKKGAGVVSSAKDPAAMSVIRRRAYQCGCSLVELGRDFQFSNVFSDLKGTAFDYEGTRTLKNIETNLLGSHQAENAATAIAACDAFAQIHDFELNDMHILEGLRSVHWPGRLEIVSNKPLTILDCAHNPSAVRRLIQSLDELGIGIDTLVYSSSQDKDYKSVANMLFPRAKRLVLTRYGSERACPPETLASLPETKGKGVIVEHRVSEAIERAKRITDPSETILVTGSIFLVGDALSWLKQGVGADFSLAGLVQQRTPKG
ncbi:MAG: folylpolyglutamate synthase/dihydrofolate synthase family protein [Thermoplasmata archaeon]